MLSSAYYRRQADICLAMALAARDEPTAEEFRALALAFMSKAAEAQGNGVATDLLQGQDGGAAAELRRE